MAEIILNLDNRQVKAALQKVFWIIKVFAETILLIIWKGIKVTIKGFPAIGLYIVYKVTFHDFKIDYFQTIYLLTPLAILIGFSSLLYSRARAVNDPDQQQKSLLAADSIFRGSIFYSLALVWGFVISAAYIGSVKDGYTVPNYLFEFLYLPSFFAMAKAYSDLFDGLSSLWKYIKTH